MRCEGRGGDLARKVKVHLSLAILAHAAFHLSSGVRGRVRNRVACGWLAEVSPDVVPDAFNDLLFLAKESKDLSPAVAFFLRLPKLFQVDHFWAKINPPESFGELGERSERAAKEVYLSCPSDMLGFTKVWVKHVKLRKAFRTYRRQFQPQILIQHAEPRNQNVELLARIRDGWITSEDVL